MDRVGYVFLGVIAVGVVLGVVVFVTALPDLAVPQDTEAVAA